MEQQSAEAKSARLLDLYARFISGQTLNKQDLASEYGVTTRSIQRDMESLRCFLMEKGLSQEIIYDRRHGGYRMVSSVPSGLTNSEILAVCKILLESRSMRRDEMLPILDKLVDCCVPEENKRAVQQMTGNEKLHYIEPHHGQPILRGLWELGQAVQQRQVLELDYQRLKGAETVRRTVEPVGILFSEYYFYLAAYLRGVDRKQSFENPEDPYPTIYRIDRIRAFRATGEHFTPAYAKCFQEGEFRRRVQFMYGGKLQKIRFRYAGPSIEAVLDRLPTAEILSQDDSGWTISAEVFGKGIEMWMRSQGDYIQEIHEKERDQHGKPGAN